jgi:hypothetical protein
MNFKPAERTILVVCQVERIRKLLQSLIVYIYCSHEESGGLPDVRRGLKEDRIMKANFGSISSTPFLAGFFKVNSSCA